MCVHEMQRVNVIHSRQKDSDRNDDTIITDGFPQQSLEAY